MKPEVRVAFFTEEPRRMYVFAMQVDGLPPVGSEVHLRDERFPPFPVEEHGKTEHGVPYALAGIGPPEMVAQFGGFAELRASMEREGFELVSTNDIPYDLQ